MADVESDLSYPVFGVASVNEVKIKGTGNLNYPGFSITSDALVRYLISGNSLFPAYTFEGVGGTVETAMIANYPSFGSTFELDAAYEASLDIVMTFPETSGDSDIAKGRRSVQLIE